ncbi:hypothetical protein P9112_009011 [Eukaryota sp. TZLM1-RC]
MKDALSIINKLVHDTFLSKERFFVGFEDRFGGVFFLPLHDFLALSVPSHRIRYISKETQFSGLAQNESTLLALLHLLFLYSHLQHLVFSPDIFLLMLLVERISSYPSSLTLFLVV